MPPVHFSHTFAKKSLTISFGLDDVEWGYNLNTVTYPTYGGEVVQILSAYTDNIQLGGTVRSYAKMEEIYSWFLEYMQNATQGGVGTTKYTQSPVVMTYPERGWRWEIYPLSLPGFIKGREIVAPTWRMEAAVYDEEDATKDANMQAAMDGLERVTLGIGYDPDNPFSEPFKEGTKRFSVDDMKEYWEKIGDYYGTLIPAYMKGDYDSILGEIGSKPALLDRHPPKPDAQRDSNK